MQQRDWPAVRDLLLVGGGHAHALLLRRWGMRPQPGVRLTLLDPGPVAPYTGMLPGFVAGHYRREEMMIDLVRLAGFAGARFVEGRAEAIDRDARRVRLSGGRWLRYDAMSLDVGIGSGLAEVPGFAAHGVAAKPLGGFAARWERFLATAPATPRIVVIGAGVGGVELAMAMAFRLRGTGRTPAVGIVERGPKALDGLGASARTALGTRMAAFGIEVLTDATVARIGPDTIALADGRVLGSDFTLTVSGAVPQPWLAGTGLTLAQGFVVVDAHLRSSDPAIFGAGDCVHMGFAPRPKAGVFAVRQAPILDHNLRAALSGGPMRTFAPQRGYLKLISTGGRAAVAVRSGFALEGGWLWRWKDRIDRRFMAKFETFPPMALPPPPPGAAEGLAAATQGQPLCGGCGAKVGPGALASVLTGLAGPSRAEVVSGPGDDAAILRAAAGFQVLSTDHLRAFTADPALMARIAAIHALGDIHAMGADPQVALAQVVLPRSGGRIEADMLAEVMAAVEAVVREAGADLVGGHTSVGAELMVGLTATGLASRTLGKGGARPGDALILTKPLGTGVLLAAAMAGRPVPGILLGEAVSEAFGSMTRSLGPASRLLAPLAHAMTDVTGFGLAAHLLEICRASGVGATVRLGDVPILRWAQEASAAGHASSLAPANRLGCEGSVILARDDARAALLFDPQTAGGLLAAVPARQAPGVLRALGEAGCDAAIVGRVDAGPVRIVVEG